MKQTLCKRIAADLKESQIDRKVIVAFIPIAFFTYFFHESGHWIFGVFTGNDMLISLNNSSPKNGHFIHDSDALWSAIGGPAFTVLQGLLFLLLTSLTKSIYSYSLVFFAVFSRLFSILFGGVNLQDEARIASMLDIHKYLVVSIIATILLLILWKSTRIMKLDMKAVGYFTVLGVYAILIVIGINGLL
ncbi:MAG: hypothetical protein HZA79_01825 [Sphingobacteriales bacterium]|nr:hypothetical protein [Sphingobacteriales bacterium]